MRYEVRRIRDDELPQDQDWAMARCGDRVTLFVKDKASGDLATHAEAWAAFRLLDRDEAPTRFRLVRSGS